MAGGEICGDLTDIYPEPVSPVQLDFSLKYCNGLIGYDIPRDIVITILRALEFGVTETSDADVLQPTVPTSEPTTVALSQPGDPDLSNSLQQTVSNQLSAQGFNEILNNSLTSLSYYETLEQMNADRCVKVLNPLSRELSVMRQTLLFGGLESIAHNVKRRASGLRFYEFGKVYANLPAKESTPERPLAPYTERMELALWITGNKADATWNAPAMENSVYEMRGVVDALLRRLGIDPQTLTAVQFVSSFCTCSTSSSPWCTPAWTGRRCSAWRARTWWNSPSCPRHRAWTATWRC